MSDDRPDEPTPLCQVLNEVADAGASAKLSADDLRRMLLDVVAKEPWGQAVVGVLNLLRERGQHDLIAVVLALCRATWRAPTSTPGNALLSAAFVEVSQDPGGQHGGGNYGKFMVARFSDEAWSYAAAIGGGTLLRQEAWCPHHVLVLDVATGEGGLFPLVGIAQDDLKKRKIHVCPLFPPFLDWLYAEHRRTGRLDVTALPAVVALPDAPDIGPYRRPGLAAEAERAAALAAIVSEPAVLAAAYARADGDDRLRIEEAYQRFQAKMIREAIMPTGELGRTLAHRLDTASEIAMRMLQTITAAATEGATDTQVVVEIRRAQNAAARQVIAVIDDVLETEARALDAEAEAEAEASTP
jgi:hypothetical protein